MEDTTALWPVAIEATRFKEAITLFEEEVISDQLVLGVSIHAVERVEVTSKVTLEGVAGRSDLNHDFVTLLVGDARAERIVSKVTADTDTGGIDKGSLLLREGRAVELFSVHVRHVLGARCVAVILLNYRVKKLAKGLVGIHGTCVTTNTRVDVLAAREDAGLERDTSLVALVVVCLPHILSKILADKRFGVCRELGPAYEILRLLEFRSASGTARGGFRTAVFALVIEVTTLSALANDVPFMGTCELVQTFASI